ncbi:MAG: response regulator [Chlamydiota bacterium]|nr:response regulator [Chlamydiota bacterium]
MKKILIIEDTASLREGINDILAINHYEVISAPDGKRGLRMAREFFPDLIMCDIMMPGLDGYEVLKQIRKDPFIGTIPFIFLTAKATKSDMRHGMNIGADDYLVKPFTEEELMESIRARLEKHALLHLRQETVRRNLMRALQHELRTPLAGILMGVDAMVQMRATDTPEMKQIEDVCKKYGVRLQHLIEKYILFSTLEVMMDDVDKRQELLSNQLEKSEALIRETVSEKITSIASPIELIYHLNDVSVYMTEDYFKKIVEELLENAIKFSNKGSAVTVNTYVDQGMYVLEVKNMGCGMSAQQISNVEAFVQFDRDQHEQQGVGLGLIIVKRLVELHDGIFNIISVPGETITVQIKLRIVK